MKKSFFYSMAALLVAGAAFTACSSSDNDIENGQIEQPEAKKYTLTVEAEKGEYVAPSATRATLSLDAQNNLQANWENNNYKRDEVDVYHGNNYVGTLYAQSNGSASTLLTGSIDYNGYTPDEGDELTLKFNELVDISGTQGYTLKDLEPLYSAKATVKITSINGSDIKTNRALFVAQHAIVRLNLSDEVYTLTMTANGKTYETGTISPTREVWFAIYGFDTQKVTITASGYANNGTNYSYTNPDVTVKNGDFYDIDVTLVAQ